MKASELIAVLQDRIKDHGDRDVRIFVCDFWDNIKIVAPNDAKSSYGRADAGQPTSPHSDDPFFVIC